MGDAHAAHFEHKHRGEAELGAFLVVMIDADRPDGDVFDPLVDLHPALLVGCEAAQNLGFAADQGHIVVVRVLVADRDRIGVQVSRRQVANVAGDRIHHHARSSRAFQQKARLAVPGQVRHRAWSCMSREVRPRNQQGQASQQGQHKTSPWRLHESTLAAGLGDCKPTEVCLL